MMPIKFSLSEVLRLLRELLIIFASIVLAFLFDDYRESKNERSHYVRDLLYLRKEVAGLAGDIKDELDTFKLKEDRFRGRQFERLLHLEWFDSLMKTNRATLRDYRFMIREGALDVILAGGFGSSPLAREILVKYGEQMQTENAAKWLRIYEEEMVTSQRFHESLSELSKEIDRFRRRMNPYEKFTKADSVLMYSNEFIGSFREYLQVRKNEYGYGKYLSENRLVRTLHYIDMELQALGETVKEEDCFKIVNIRERIECIEGRKLTVTDSLLSVAELAVMKRK